MVEMDREGEVSNGFLSSSTREYVIRSDPECSVSNSSAPIDGKC